MNIYVIQTSLDVPPATIVKPATPKDPKFVKLGNGVHGHRREHRGQFFMHYHQHQDGDFAHDHIPDYWLMQMVCYDERMSFIVPD